MSTTQINPPPEILAPTSIQRIRSRLGRKTPGTIALYIGVALFLLVVLGPIYWIILSAFTPITELFTTPLSYFPAHPSLVNFQTVAQIVPLGQQFFNSTILSVLSASF